MVSFCHDSYVATILPQDSLKNGREVGIQTIHLTVHLLRLMLCPNLNIWLTFIPF